jgi:exonuclease VII large subunit
MERAELEIDGFLEGISDSWRSKSLSLARSLDESAADMMRGAGESVGRSRTSLDSTLDGLAQGNPSGRMRLAAGSIDHGLRVMMVRMSGDLSLRTKEIAGRLGALAELDPRGVLKRGYSFCTADHGARVIPRAGEISPGDDLTVHFYDGGVLCSVREKRKGRPWRKK